MLTHAASRVLYFLANTHFLFAIGNPPTTQHSTFPPYPTSTSYFPTPPCYNPKRIRYTFMQSYHFPRLTLPDEIGEVSAQHPITLERLRKINETASAPVKKRRSIPSSIRIPYNYHISMADATHNRPDTMDPPQTPTPFDLESFCLLYTSPSPRDRQKSRMPSSA